ncbi:hypothetical protein EJ04DRAFT_476343 [Polyplosphaeria fusca]|uniref:Histone transcription regulator 3 homolog n=1 Tax=Polyplosphaeria fusca TaxID=682080 RepID=A0A9P4QQG9_9PLEO|nr:hypothetical protein EJ04DRAFT_476343 [Polyplosphaeria fusca]
MSNFKALNVESDNESEDEIDNTKEIQIEDALKLYQTALKYHAEGPESFPKAADAYRALFDSDIFKYQESLSEYKRHELFGDTLVFDSILQDDFDAGPVQLAGGNDVAPNTLPQILHLSHKNHGQFMLETMQHWMQEHGAPTPQEGTDHIFKALGYFSEALDKEDSDLDLWIRTASVAALLGSKRITRFCLEAVLDGDDELVDSILRLPGLEEGFAGQQLRELVEKMEDSLSLTQAPFATMRRKKLSETLKKRLNPYPFAPLPSNVSKPPTSTLVRSPERVYLSPTKWDWAGVGEVILHHFMAEQGGFIEPAAGSSIGITVPPDSIVEDDSPATTHENGEDLPTVSRNEQAKSASETEEGAVANTTEANQPSASDENKVQDVVMEDNDGVPPKNDEGGSATPRDSVPPQSRKRSTDSAGLPDTADGGRVRRKRIRTRDSVTEGTIADSTGPDLAKQLEDKLYSYNHADSCLSEIVNDTLEKLGVPGLGSPQELRNLASQADATPDNSIDRAACDMFMAIQSGSQKTAAAWLSSEAVDLGGMTREAGLNAFLGHAKSGISQTSIKPLLVSERLTRFAQDVNSEWLSIKEVALAWLEILLLPGSLPSTKGVQHFKDPSYMHYRWAEDLKRHLVQIIVNFDDYIYERALDRVAEMNNKVLETRARGQDHQLTERDQSYVEMTETLFELHLDIYSLIKHPHSGVDVVTQTLQSDRLERWAALARDAMQLRSACNPDIGLDDLALRHIWASVFQLSVNDQTQPEHVIRAMEELKMIFQTMDGPIIEVQNNAVMPELSVAAIDRELARISMKDFFLRVFDQDEKDPVAVIESLEPILEPSEEPMPEANRATSNNEEEQEGPQTTSTIETPPELQMDIQRPSPHQEMRKFLDTAAIHLRLSLWQRLREAYEAIEYPTKVLSCYLRSIETLIDEFKSTAYTELTAQERHVKLLGRLRIIDEILVKILPIARSEKTALDCLSYEHVQSSMTAISELLRIMSAANFFEDLVRIHHSPAPRFEGSPNGTFLMFTARLHDMQLRAWMLQYYLLKEGISQTPEQFPTPSDDLFEFIRHIHYATGVRGFCHLAGRVFLRLAKDEILRLDDVGDSQTRDTELAQVLYDLYGLKTFEQPLDCHEFSSISEVLDKKTAHQLLPFIMSQARKFNIKDLPKTDLKATIDKVHGALGRSKSNEDISLNRKVLTTYFKSPINPISLFDCLKGVGALSTKHIPVQAALAASKGWHFLMGNIALNKFRAQKRLTQGPTEDLNFAQAFFLQDLEYSVDCWETWYRLAQANDSQLEESVSWNADKINNNSVELIHFQRAAIHCYVMAVASAVRTADASHSTMMKLSAMYTDFGNRIYASSREPFSMAAFNIRDNEQKFYSGSMTMAVYQNIPFSPLPVYTAWKFASVLFKRAIKSNPDRWWNYYMLAKCQWKMYCANDNAAREASRSGEIPQLAQGPNWEQVVDAAAAAIDMLPERKERQQPVLEPHYKLVSIVHKLFLRGAISYEKAQELLQPTSFSQNIEAPENADDWERYVLAVLKALRAADKQSWHHRIIVRSAHVIYDDSKDDQMVAFGAKMELTDRIFTKTMTVQVWKPENERPGRHFVYTSRYTRFFVTLLIQCGDKTNLEALAKRVRRKTTDFFEHTKLWQDFCLIYLKFLRRAGKVPEGHEDAVFKSINNDEFQLRAARLEAWCQGPTSQSPTLDVLRDVVELKRLNNGLMKALLIDDLIGDTYALLYETAGQGIEPLPTEQPQQLQQHPQLGAGPLSQPVHGPPQFSAAGPSQIDGAADMTNNPNLPFSIYHPTQLQGPQPESTSRPRAKAVGRRELQRRAEACTVKAVVPVQAPTTMPIRSPTTASQPLPTIAARTSPEKQMTEAPPAVASSEQLQVPPSGTATAAASVTNVESSAPASVHDDADDESELSELDESEVQEMREEAGLHDPDEHTIHVKPLFPNVGANKKEKEKDVDTSAAASNAGTPTAEEK